MKIEKDKVVSVDYVLRDAEGNEINSTIDEDPFDYLHGHSNIVPGLETELEGLVAGDQLKTEIPPETGYGLRNEAMVQKVPRQQFAQLPEIRVGMQLSARHENRTIPVTIVGVDDESVTIDANHPLAGKVLFYEVQVAAVRDATSEEVAHHHPHQGDSGCGHEHQGGM